ncbi:MAG: LamG domain-containing protein, partial [Candidatus Omnitrophica bacterium]|nr:LamG domain-containing protein [Candidatus Omnitrophota bacterium]
TLTSDITGYYRLTFDNAGGTWTFPDTAVTVTSTLTIANGTAITDDDKLLTLNDVDINDAFTMQANDVRVRGSWDATGGAFTSTGTLMFNADADVTITSNTNAFSNVIINDGLIGYWSFDETASPAVDHSGYANSGTWTGNTTSSTTTPSGINYANPRSVSFDGTDDSVNVGSDSLFDLRQDFTIAAWVNPSALVSFPMVFCKGTVNTEYLLFADTATSNRFLFRVDQGGLNDVRAATSAVVGTWHHVAGVYDGANIRIYVNGVEDATPVAVTGNIDTADTDLHIGSCGGTGNEWNGLIDDARVYNRALTAAEILELGSGNMPGAALATYTLQDAMDVNGTLTINAGDLNTGANQNINLAGSWLNYGGVFTATNGNVFFDGTSPAAAILA